MRSNLFKLAQVVVLAAAMAFTFSCSSGDDGGGSGGSISGYKTKQIGNQVWMAENLNYNVQGSKCYKDDPANCTKYGRLYDWATAMDLPSRCNSTTCASQIGVKHRGICPSGWHIPSNDDWDELIDFVGGALGAGIKLKSKMGWGVPAGTDEYGFSALPGGNGYSDGSFNYVGESGAWWSAYEIKSRNADSWFIDDEDVYHGNSGKENLFSVRCLQDSP